MCVHPGGSPPRQAEGRCHVHAVRQTNGRIRAELPGAFVSDPQARHRHIQSFGHQEAASFLKGTWTAGRASPGNLPVGSLTSPPRSGTRHAGDRAKRNSNPKRDGTGSYRATGTNQNNCPRKLTSRSVCLGDQLATEPSLSPFSFPRKPGQKVSKPRRHESAQCLTKLSPPPAKPARPTTINTKDSESAPAPDCRLSPLTCH